MHLLPDIRKVLVKKTRSDYSSNGGADASSDDEPKPPPKQKSTLTYFMSQDFCYAPLVKRAIRELRISITLFQPMLVCDELEGFITSTIQSAAKEAGLKDVPSAIDGRVRTAVCHKSQHVINLINVAIDSQELYYISRSFS